jgi:4-hydroxybenzoate polyprenyltransferase/phosphoserine phosphatase
MEPTALESLPLCVDMDGTLLRTDTLHESAIGAVLADWRVGLSIPGWLRQGKALLKQELAERWRFNAAELPYDQDLLAFLRAERARGRHIVLCTAAHRSIAERVARHLGIFDEVIATEGDRNLRGPAKGEALCQRFGRAGFIYAGNDSTDEPVWEAAAAAIVVNASDKLRAKAERSYRVLAVFGDQRGIPRALLRAMRPHQWIKNSLCLVPLLAAGDFSAQGLAHALLVMAAFCLVASAIYLVNDLSDLAADRAHPRKSRRPLASGALPISHGLALVPILLVIGAALAAASGALDVVAVYAVCSVAYSMGFKEQPLLDVFLLALLYTIRLFGGGVATGHEVSLWLLGFSSFLFLSLALVKRVSELHRQLGTTKRAVARRGYTTDDIAILQMFGCASTFASTIVLSLYVQSDVASRAYANPDMLWGTIPLLLFWQCRLWLSTARGYMHDDPIVYAARDWVSWIVLGCLAAVVAVSWLPPLP